MRHGFSLVELSIVLVILGLLTGGILGGQALIRAAQMRTLTLDYNKFHTAIHSFRDKYFALPGDMTNATAFWGVAAGDGIAENAPCRTTATTDGRTCNGDGNGRISCNTMGCSFYEVVRGWQQLARAGFIEGNYVGAPSPGYFVSGVTTPDSRIADGGVWFMVHYSPLAGGTTFYETQEGHTLSIEGPSGAPNYLTPAEAWNIDTKLDDGIPNRGGITSVKGTAALPCSTTANQPVAADVNSQYNLASQAVACRLYFRF